MGLGTGNKACDTYREVELEIGDWDMDTDETIMVAHGLSDHTKIRSIDVIIRNNTDTQSRPLNSVDVGVGSTAINGGIASFNSTWITLKRFDAGDFDDISHNSTSYNRGWIYIQYATR